MSTLTLDRPATSVLSPQDAEVVASVRNLQRASLNYRESLAEIGFYGWRIRFKMGGSAGNTGDLWPTIGFESEDQFRETLGIPQSTWYEWLKIGQVLCNLSIEELKQIKPTNAKLLTQVDPALVGDYPWVKEAKSLSSNEFALLISQRNKQKGIQKEPTAYYKVKVPATAKVFLEETVERFRVKHKLESSAQALEMLIADVHDRPNTMNAMRRAGELVNNAMTQLQPDGRTYQWLYRARQILFKTYSAVREGDADEEDEETVCAPQSVYKRTYRLPRAGSVFAEPARADGPPRAGRPALEEPSGYMYPMQAPDEFGGNDDDLEDGGEG